MSDHALFDFETNQLVCKRCKDNYQILLPQPVWVITALFKAFSKRHDECEEETDE